jgi:hypothetical protein
MKTTNYESDSKIYIALEYTSLSAPYPFVTFNPYVNLVHGSKYLNMPGSYAFSVDDDVGNMLVAGTGIIITVGGSAGLENTVQYDKLKLVNINLGDPGKSPAWSQYGFCQGQPVRNITTLSLQITSVIYPCTVALTDMADRQYKFTLASPPFHTTEDQAFISNCSAPSGNLWCETLTTRSETSPEVKNYVQARAPPPLQ